MGEGAWLAIARWISRSNFSKVSQFSLAASILQSKRNDGACIDSDGVSMMHVIPRRSVMSVFRCRVPVSGAALASCEEWSSGSGLVRSVLVVSGWRCDGGPNVEVVIGEECGGCAVRDDKRGGLTH